MLIVKDDPSSVEADLDAGVLRCPRCDGRLRRHGFSSPRQLRTLEGTRQLRPRRTICSSCATTQVLEPASTIPRLRDTAEVLGAAWLAKVAGAGHRAIAQRLDRPVSTVRRWLRRLDRRAPDIARCARSWLIELDSSIDLRSVTTTGSSVGDALEWLSRAARAASLGLGVRSPWEYAVALTGGLVVPPSARAVSRGP